MSFSLRGTPHPAYPNALPVTSTATEKEAQDILVKFGRLTYVTAEYPTGDFSHEGIEYVYSGPWNNKVDDIWAAADRIEKEIEA